MLIGLILPSVEKEAVLAGEAANQEMSAAGAVAFLRNLSDPFGGDREIRSRVQNLVAKLGHDSFAERRVATEALKKMDPNIVPLLANGAESCDPEVAMRTHLVISFFRSRVDALGNEINAAIDVLVSERDERLIPILLKLLGNADRGIRFFAEYGIRRATGKSFGFSAYAIIDDRKKCLELWQAWWSKTRETDPWGFLADANRSAAALGVVIADEAASEIVFANLEGRILWRRVVPQTPYAATILPNGHYLVGHKQGATEYDREHRKVWSSEKAKLGANQRVYDLNRLENGNTLLCLVDSGIVTELDPQGQIVWQIKDLKSPGAAWRMPNGHTLICENHKNQLIEVNLNQEIVWSKEKLQNPADVMMLGNGNVLAAEWTLNRAFELDRSGEIVWVYQSDKNVNSARRLPDGNTVVSQVGEVVLVDYGGKQIRTLHSSKRKYAKVNVIPLPRMLPSK